MTPQEISDCWFPVNARGMSDAELDIFNQLLKNKEIRADHPITVLNPHEWFKPYKVDLTDNQIFVSGIDTCWFRLSQCEMRDRSSHDLTSDRAAEMLILHTRELKEKT